MICGFLFEEIFDFDRMSIASYATEVKAKRCQIKTQSTQKKRSHQPMIN